MNARILVPVDGSEPSFKAVDFAADLADKYGSTLYLLHVVPPGRAPRELERWARMEHIADPPEWLYEQAVADNILGAAEHRARERGAETIERMTGHGDAAREIVAAAKRIDADLVVMGTRGLSDLQGLLMGSVAHKVMHTAPCTVVAVR